jgi:streptogramin lyase
VVTEFFILTVNSEPLGIAAGPDGNLWFTEFAGAKVGRVTPPETLTVGPDFRVETPGSVTVRAADRVVLTNGFSVGSGGTFRAGIDPSLAP